MLPITLLAFTLSADPQPYKFTSNREDDKLTVKVEKDRTLFDITSPTGIGEMVIERTGENWPETLVVHLHISGLDHFHAKSEKVTIIGFMSSQSEGKVSLSVDKKKDDPKDPKSEFFMDFKMIGKDGKPATELPKGGYFEFKLPKPFLEGNPKSVTLAWIDFLRR